MSIKISPSILSADFAAMGKELRVVERSGADLVHCDVMDGVFVNNITFGIKMIADIKKHTNLPLEVHLMIINPENHLNEFIRAGADYLTFHLEATQQPQECIDIIKKSGVKVGMAIKPRTNISQLEPYLSQLDVVIVMGVDPGFGAQKYMPETTDKIAQLRRMIDDNGYKAEILMDGGLNETTAQEIVDAGTDILVSGSAFFAAKDKKKYVKNLRGLAK